MSVRVQATLRYEEDFAARSPDDQVAIDAAVRNIRAVARAWKRGPLPIQDFDAALDIHQVSPGEWSAAWEQHNGRMTFSLEDVDTDGYPERLVLHRVGGHEIYAAS